MRVLGRYGKLGSRSGYSMIELLVVVAIVGILARLSVPSYLVLRQLAWDRVALSDVLNAGKALESLDSTATISRTVKGPGAIPGLPGPRVSRGTTLLVQRTRSGTRYSTYVRGSNSRGTLTYYFQNGDVMVSKGRL